MKLRRELTITATADHPALGQLLFTAVRPEVAQIDVRITKLDGSAFEQGMDAPHVRFAAVPGSLDDRLWTAESVLWGGQDIPIERELAMQRLDFFVDCLGGELVRPKGKEPSKQFDRWNKHREHGNRLKFVNLKTTVDRAVLQSQQRWSDRKWAATILTSSTASPAEVSKALSIMSPGSQGSDDALSDHGTGRKARQEASVGSPHRSSGGRLADWFRKLISR